MKEIEYDNVKILNAEQIMNLGCADEIIYSADGKKILIKEEKLYEKIKKVMQPVINAFIEIGKIAMNISQKLARSLLEISKRISTTKLTKKKFMKLLQAEGIQRNEIKKIVKNNRKKYTYARLYNTVNEYYKKQQK